jgi:hypothetical protein
VNVLLVAAKVVAVLYSSSISLTASLVDSALDLLSTFIILGTSWAIGLKTDQHLVCLVSRFSADNSTRQENGGSSRSEWFVHSIKVRWG